MRLWCFGNAALSWSQLPVQDKAKNIAIAGVAILSIGALSLAVIQLSGVMPIGLLGHYGAYALMAGGGTGAITAIALYSVAKCKQKSHPAAPPTAPIEPSPLFESFYKLIKTDTIIEISSASDLRLKIFNKSDLVKGSIKQNGESLRFVACAKGIIKGKPSIQILIENRGYVTLAIYHDRKLTLEAFFHEDKKESEDKKVVGKLPLLYSIEQGFYLPSDCEDPIDLAPINYPFNHLNDDGRVVCAQLSDAISLKNNNITQCSTCRKEYTAEEKKMISNFHATFGASAPKRDS